jgi:hypothetical protein
MLAREVKNIEYIDGSDLVHSSDDEGSNGLPAKKTMTRNDQFDEVLFKLSTRELVSRS